MAGGTAIQQPQQTQPLARKPSATLADVILSRRDAFAQVAPKHFSVDRLVKLAQASLSRTPKLAQCTGESVLIQLMRCAELGLEPNSPLGGMHLVPYENRKTGKTECQGIIDYRGLVALARRSEQIAAIAARVVYSQDRFECYEDETGVHFRFEQAAGDRGQMVEVFAYATLKSGEVQFDRMSRGDVDKIRARSRASSSGPWVTDYDEMAKKTVLRRLSKLLPMTTEAAALIAEEESVEAEAATGEVPTANAAERLVSQVEGLKSKLRAKTPAPPPMEMEDAAAPGEQDQALEPGHDPASMEQPAPESGEARKP